MLDIFIIIIILLCLADIFLVVYAVNCVNKKNKLKKTEISLTSLFEKSEEKRIKAEIERDKSATVISSFNDGLIILDERDKIFLINPEAKKNLGLETDRLLKKSFQFLSDFQKAKPIASALNEGLENIYRKQIELEKDCIIELSVTPLNLNKNNIGHLIIIHDVSREKIVERMKTEFVSLAAHQLRTPLSAIKWSIDMLKKGDFGKLTKKQNVVVKSILENNERLISLVNGLLDVARIEENGYLYKTAMTDVREIIALAINSYKDEIKDKKIKIDFKKPDNFPKMMLDTERIRLVIQNFIDNAIKYSPKGGKIIISLKKDEKNIELKVQDFGIGIPKSQQDKIFTKFARGNNAIKINATGSGLGLFSSKNIIEAHGGKIWFDSKENVGTSFYFSLPFRPDVK